MKPVVCLYAAMLSLGAPLWAQDGPDRITVPLREPNRAYTLKVDLVHGGITVRGGANKEMIIESATRSRKSRPQPARADGMRRIDVPASSGLAVEEEAGVVRINTESWRNAVDLIVQVPNNTSVKLSAVNGGDIVVENVAGEIDVNNTNGKVMLNNVSGTVIAHALNGRLVAVMDRVNPDKPMSFSTLNGDIDVTLPADVRAKLRLKADNGETYSDFDIKMDPTQSQVSTDNGDQRGRYRVRVDRSAVGSINGGGGPEIRFQTMNGQIYIRKKK